MQIGDKITKISPIFAFLRSFFPFFFGRFDFFLIFATGIYNLWLMNEKEIDSLLKLYGIDSKPDFKHLVKISVNSFTMLPKTKTWDESHFLQGKMEGLDFAAVCMKTLNVDSRTAYEIGLVKVVEWEVVDTFSSYMNPVAPLSKALRKSLPEKLIQKIDEAPKLLDLWPRISHFFESHVLYGSGSLYETSNLLC